MSSMRVDGLVSRFDRWLAQYLLPIISILVALCLQITLVVTMLRIPEYSAYTLCLTGDCFGTLGDLIGAQVEVIKAGGALVSFIVVVAGVYLAMRTYIATSQVGMLGNAIAHITFYERFVSSEILRRGRLSPRHVDVFGVYTLMFPSGNDSQRYASEAFSRAIDSVYDVVKESSRRYQSRENIFKFDDHRRRLIDSLRSVYITLEPIPRIDFLEVEDEVLEFLSMLSRVFARPGSSIEAPVRAYR